MKTKSSAENPRSVLGLQRKMSLPARRMSNSEILDVYTSLSENAPAPVNNLVASMIETCKCDVKQTLIMSRQRSTDITIDQLGVIAAVEIVITSPVLVDNIINNEKVEKLGYGLEVMDWAKNNMKPGSYNLLSMMDYYCTGNIPKTEESLKALAGIFDPLVNDMHLAAVTIAPKRKIMRILGKEEYEVDGILKKRPKWISDDVKEFEGHEVDHITRLLGILRAAENESRGVNFS